MQSHLHTAEDDSDSCWFLLAEHRISNNISVKAILLRASVHEYVKTQVKLLSFLAYLAILISYE